MSITIYAQQQYIGLIYGNGKMDGNHFSDDIINSFGIKYQHYYTEHKDSWYIEENFEQIKHYDFSKNKYIQISQTTLGGNLILGNKLYAILGVGIDFLIPFGKNVNVVEFYIVSIRAKLNIGFGYAISSKFRINLTGEYHTWITSFDKISYSFASNLITEYNKERGGLVTAKLGISYLIK